MARFRCRAPFLLKRGHDGDRLGVSHAERELSFERGDSPMSQPDIAALTHSDSELPPSERSRAVDWNKPRVAAILAAAARCFARSGFETTTAEIAKELGVPKSIIYHYFDNKTAL